jgi:signal transduction histidine kinase
MQAATGIEKTLMRYSVHPDLQTALALAFDAQPQPVIITNVQGLVVTMNRAARLLTGREVMPDKQLTILDVADHTSRSTLQNVVSGSHSAGATRNVQIRLDTDQSLVAVNATPLSAQSHKTMLLHWELQREPFSSCGFADKKSWFQFLTDASFAFSGLMQVEQTCQRIVDEAVPRISDWCTLDFVEPGDQHLRRAAVAHLDPQRAQSVTSVRRRYPVADIGKHPVLTAIKSGEPTLIPEFSDELVRELTKDEMHFEFVRGLGLRSSMIFPLLDNEIVYGAITFASAESGRLYSDTDINLIQAYVDRASQAIVAARHHERTLQLSRIQEHYLSVASHEIRTPLAVVGGFAGLLTRQVTSGKLDLARTRMLAEELQHGIDRLEMLTEDLLVASSLQESETSVTREEVDLLELAEHVARRFTVMLPDQTRDSIVVTGPPGVTGNWSSNLLERALSNLIGNAIKYSPNEVTIRVDVTQPDSRRAQIAVSDKGMGISEEDQNHLFEPFARGTIARRMTAGTGLGLHITRQIVEQQSGSIDASSSPGEGSTFTVTLPLTPPASSGGSN